MTDKHRVLRRWKLGSYTISIIKEVVSFKERRKKINDAEIARQRKAHGREKAS